MKTLKSPKIFNNFLDKNTFLELKDYVKNIDKETAPYDTDMSRYEFGNTEFLTTIHHSLTPIAKSFFESDTLVPSFNFGSWYHKNAKLEVHKDVAACTYSIDLCVYQKTPWDLYIEGVPYTLQENDAVLYYGESQKHWRSEFPDPENNIVCNVFFFYVEPDHWYFTEPEEKHLSIRRKNQIERNGTGEK